MLFFFARDALSATVQRRCSVQWSPRVWIPMVRCILCLGPICGTLPAKVTGEESCW